MDAKTTASAKGIGKAGDVLLCTLNIAGEICRQELTEISCECGRASGICT